MQTDSLEVGLLLTVFLKGIFIHCFVLLLEMYMFLPIIDIPEFTSVYQFGR